MCLISARASTAPDTRAGSIGAEPSGEQHERDGHADGGHDDERVANVVPAEDVIVEQRHRRRTKRSGDEIENEEVQRRALRSHRRAASSRPRRPRPRPTGNAAKKFTNAKRDDRQRGRRHQRIRRRRHEHSRRRDHPDTKRSVDSPAANEPVRHPAAGDHRDDADGHREQTLNTKRPGFLPTVRALEERRQPRGNAEVHQPRPTRSRGVRGEGATIPRDVVDRTR